MIGFQSLSLSALPLGIGVRNRFVGVASAFACLLFLCFGTGLLGYIPKFILGGILFYNGLSFLTQWVIDAYFRLIREDYLLVVLILAIVAGAGYLQGRRGRGHHRNDLVCAKIQQRERDQYHPLRRQPSQFGRPLPT